MNSLSLCLAGQELVRIVKVVGCDQLEAMVLEACPVCGCDVGLVESLDQCMFAFYHKCTCKG